jgi:hygromycin-B 7''-O-kinase
MWLPAMRVICEQHGLDATRLEFAPPGSHVVFRVRPDRYIKLFAPLWRRDFVPERLVLGKLSEQADWPIPRLVAEGEIENWPYVIMTAVEGVPLYEVWSSMEMPDRERIAARCGELMAFLHSTPTKGLDAIATDWPAFVESRMQDCVNQLIQSDIDEPLVQSTLEFLDDLPPLFEPDFQPVLLNADVTDEHILVSVRRGRWELTGFIDFGDAMLGHPYYDFVAPGCCITHGSPKLQRTMLLAYGFSQDQLDATTAEQLMAYTLVHRFIDIPYLLTLFDSQKPNCLEDLKEGLWSFSDKQGP